MNTERSRSLKRLRFGDKIVADHTVNDLVLAKISHVLPDVKDKIKKLLINREHEDLKPKEPLLPPKVRVPTSLDVDKIHASLTFHPSKNTVGEFIAQRQRMSPFHSSAEMEELFMAREKSDTMSVKISDSDKIKYTTLTGQLINPTSDSIKQLIPHDGWLPELPQVEAILQEQSRILQSRGTTVRSMQQLNASRNIKSKSVQLLGSSLLGQQSGKIQSVTDIRKKAPLLTKQKPAVLVEIPYDPRQYQKDDYRSLERWFDEQIGDVARKHDDNNLSNEMTCLNRSRQFAQITVYSVYVTTWLEFIRLTYIESSEKGLLVQKILWSMVRLLRSLLQCQHRLIFAEQKESVLEQAEQRDLYQKRISLLEAELAKFKAQADEQFETNLTMTRCYAAVRLMNEELVSETQSLTARIKVIESEKNLLASYMTKSMETLEELSFVHSTTDQQFKTYFVQNPKTYKPQVLLKTSFLKNEQTDKQVRTITDRTVLENELTSFWRDKQTQLQLVRLQHLLLKRQYASNQSQTESPQQVLTEGTQFPEGDEPDFAAYLQQQLNDERTKWNQKEKSLGSLYVTLEELYRQSFEKVKYLEEREISLNREIAQLNATVHRMQNATKEESERTEQERQKFGQEIKGLSEQVNRYQQNIEALKTQIKQCQIQIEAKSNKLSMEHQNNFSLARDLLALKSQIGALEASNKISLLFQDSIRTKLAPSLEKFIEWVDSHNDAEAILRHAAETAWQVLGPQYLVRDSVVFLTK